MSEKNNQIEVVDDQQIGPTSEQIARFAEANVDMTRRDLFDFSKKAAMALVAAKIVSLIPAESRARREEDEEFPEYTDKNFTKVMWQELDPSDFDSSVYRLLDRIIDKETGEPLARPPLIYKHNNVKGKNKKKVGGELVNRPTSSLVFELAKAFNELAELKLKQVDQRKKVVPRIKEVASRPHRDYKRVIQIHKSVKQINDANRRTWNPLEKRADRVMDKVKKMVLAEAKAAKNLKIASSANRKVYHVEDLVPTAPNTARGTGGFDNFEEILQETRPFVYDCRTGTSYNNNARPQSDSTTIETAFMLRNVITVLYEAAYQRHKAFVNIRARADLLKNKGQDKKDKIKLLKLAKTQTSKTLRDGWAGLKVEVTAMIKIMLEAYKKETELARKIKRCRPGERPDEKPYLDEAIETIEPQIHSGAGAAPEVSDTPEAPSTTEGSAEEIEDVPEIWYLD